MKLALTLSVALAAGILLVRMKVPGGMMVGAVLATTALHLGTGLAEVPYAARFVAQSVAGAFIGCGIDRDSAGRILRLWKPALILLVCFFSLHLGLGLLIWRLSAADLLTSLMSSLPGGLSEVPLIAGDLGADAGQVLVLQFFRMLVGIGVFPALIARFSEMAPMTEASSDNTVQKSSDWRRLLAALSAAFCASFMGKLSGVPSGVMLFAMLAIILFNLLIGKVLLPTWFRRVAQLLSGAYIGCGISRADVAALPRLWLPMLMILAGYTLNCFLGARLLERLSVLSRRTGMLVMTPAGVSDIALIAMDMGVTNTVDVTALHILRMLAATALFPQLDLLLMRLLG